MARTLSPTLEAQQKWGLISRPYLIARIKHRWGGVIRYEFDHVDTDPGDDHPHCACIAGDGSLNRIRLVEQVAPPPAYQVLRPNGVGSHTGIPAQHPDSGEHWQKVDEETPDENTTYVLEDEHTDTYDLYLIENPVTGAETISKVTITIRCRDTGETPHAVADTEIRTNGSTVHGDEETLTGSWKNYSTVYYTNPVTDLPWTWAEITALEAGVWLGTQYEVPARCTQVFVEVEAAPVGEYRIDHQRVASPTPESDFSSWDDLGLDNVRAAAITALGPEVIIFYNTIDAYIRYVLSNDNGATWGVQQTIDGTTKPETIIPASFDAAHKPNGDVMVAWLLHYDPPFSPKMANFQRISNVWQAVSSQYTGYALSHALSICYGDDWSAVLSLEDEDGNKVLRASPIPYSDGDAEDIIFRTVTEPFTYGKPFLRYPDSYRLFALENFTQPEEQQRIYYSQTPPSVAFTDHAWLEPVPLDLEAEFGMCLSKGGDYVWLTSAKYVYRALATEQDIDITSRLLEIDMRQYPDIRKGSLKLVLDNTGGWYNSFDRMGDEITIGFGYKTPAGYEYSLASSFWITKQKLVAPPWYPLRMIYPVGVIGTFVLETEDPWRFLYRQRTRRSLEWEAGDKTVKQLLKWFFGRAGLAFDEISSSDAANNFKPAFEVREGTSYRTAIKNLMKMIPDQVFFREQKVYLRNPTTAEAVDWTYHNLIGNALLVFRGKYGTSAWDPNRAEVWGDAFMKTKAEYPQIQKVRERLSRVTIPTYPDLTRAEERADAELRRGEVLTGEESWLSGPVNCGLEPWDKIQITDLNAGVTAIKRRVIRLKTYWNAKHWTYHQTMTLGAD